MSVVVDLLNKYNDDIRHPLVADSDDWEKTITPALVEFGNTFGGSTMDVGTMSVLRCLFETIYVIGYETGRKNAK